MYGRPDISQDDNSTGDLEGQYKGIVTTTLDNYAKALHPSVTKKGWEGVFPEDKHPFKWNYVSGFLFSLTIVTTIGLYIIVFILLRVL